MSLRRRRLVGVTAVLVLALSVVASPVPSAANPHEVKPLKATKVSAAEVDRTDPPSPPADIVGRPAASTVLRTDGLMVTQTAADGSSASRWANVQPGLDGLGDQGSPGGQRLRRALDAPITRSGRLLDAQAERVLSLQRTAAGPGEAAIQLTSLNAAAEPGWAGGNDADNSVTPRAGGTYVLTLADQQSLAVADGSGDFSDPLVGVARDATSTAQQWSLQADPDNPGYYRLVARLDGTCVNVLGGDTDDDTPIGSWPCTELPTFTDNEVWKPTAVPGRPNTYTFASLASGKLLTLANKEMQLEPASSARSQDQRWTLTEIKEPNGTVPSWSTPVWDANPLPYALAVGDLDRSVNDAGQYGDEAAVVYASREDHRLNIRVIDYNANASHLLATGPTDTMPTIGQTIKGDWYPGSLGVAIGDFDGDQLNELAVTWQDGHGFHAKLLEYAAGDGADRTLTVVKPDLSLYAASGVSPLPVASLADTTAGDFTGDDVDDLAIAFGADSEAGYPTAYAGVSSFTAGHTIAAEAVEQLSTSPLLVPDAGNAYAVRGLRALPGMFRLDSASGRTIHRRQLAVVWTDDIELPPSHDRFANTWARLLEVSPTADAAKLGVTAGPLVGVTQTSLTVAQSTPFSAAAGGFSGRGSGDAIPVWGLAVADHYSDDATDPETDIALLRVGDNGSLIPTSRFREADAGVRVDVAAYDRSGTSILLGAPVVMTVDKLVKASLIGGQPPAHSDWLGGAFVNVSRNPNFSVQLSSSSQTSYSFIHTSKASTKIGVSQGFDSKSTVEEGLFGLEKVGGSLEVEQKFGEDWESDQADTSKYSTSLSRSESSTSSDDDVVDALIVTNKVYRYPILGGPLTTTDGKPVNTDQCAKDCYGYYEVTIPGAMVLIHGYGRDDAWYQPSWQNGNALSYPTLDNGQVDIPDLGSYSYVDDQGKTVTKSGSLFNETNDLGGGSTSYALQLDTGSAADHDRSSSSSMTNSVEVKTGADVSVSIGVAKGSQQFDVSAGFSDTSTQGTTDTGETDSKSDTSFGLEVPAIDEDQGYRVGTAFYTDTAGTQKVVHGVDLTASAEGSEWWKRNYATKSDLALNLPGSTVMTKGDLGVYDQPKWSPENNRQRIRGFWALQPDDPASPVTSNVPYATNPKGGDPVRFAVQVHNYSLKESGGAPAKFYAVPVDDTGLDPVGEPTLIGTVDVPGLPAQGMTTITSPTWSAVGPTSGAGLQNYRIFVVLDPDNTLDEIHPLTGQAVCPVSSTKDGNPLVDPMTGENETLACGQNNQGYGELTVMSPGTGLQAGKGTAQVKLNGTSLLVGKGFQAPRPGGAPQVQVDQVVHGIVHVSATGGNSNQIDHVLVYDGPPAKGRLIAHSRLAGADTTNGGYADFTWQPTEAGRHVLYQVRLGRDQEQQVQKITVEVLPATPVPSRIMPLGGVGQRAGIGKSFGTRLAVRVNDENGKRLSRPEVRFAVTSGKATFAGGKRSVLVSGDSSGEATAPKLTAGKGSGPVVVTATSGSVATTFPLAVKASGRQRADLKVTLSGPTKAATGAKVSTKITVRNVGSRKSASSLLWIGLPAGLTVTDPGGGTRTGATVRLQLGGLKPKQTKTLVVTTKATSAGSQPIVAYAATGTDAHPTNNRATRTVAVSH